MVLVYVWLLVAFICFVSFESEGLFVCVVSQRFLAVGSELLCCCVGAVCVGLLFCVLCYGSALLRVWFRCVM